MHWINAEPNADIPGAYLATAEEKGLALILERCRYLYLRQLEHQVPPDHPGRSDKYNAAYLNFAFHTHRLCLEGKHRYAKKEWLNDTLEDVVAATEPFHSLLNLSGVKESGPDQATRPHNNVPNMRNSST